MKIEIHSMVMDNLMSPIFYNSIEEFASGLEKQELKAKKIQFYSDFFLPNSRYPFIDNRYVYYPLTVFYSRNKFERIWICWDNDESILSIKKIPFSAIKKVDIRVCDSVPDEFENYVKDKKLAFIQNHRFAQPVIHAIRPLENIGKINQNFVDVMAQKISEQLIEGSGAELNPKWSLEIYDTDSSYAINDKNYRIVKLKNSQAECIDIGVCWNKNYDVCDYIGDADISILLTEEIFDKRISPFSKIFSFIKNNGFVFAREELSAWDKEFKNKMQTFEASKKGENKN